MKFRPTFDARFEGFWNDIPDFRQVRLLVGKLGVACCVGCFLFLASSCVCRVCCVASKTSHLVAPSSWIEKFGSD